MNILVTGGAGFIGSNLTDRRAAQGHGIHVVDSFDTFYDPSIKRRTIRGFGESVVIHE
jgi:nucleoside-diphosphate-sugar epimerase